MSMDLIVERIPRIRRLDSTPPTCCPTCGGKLAGERSGLRWHVKSRVLISDTRALALPLVEALIFDVLWNARGGKIGVVWDTLAARVYEDRADGGPENADVCIRTYLSRMRPKLKPFGLVIRSTRVRDGGYWLVEASP